MINIIHFASGDLWAGAEVQLYTLVAQLELVEDVHVVVVLLNNGRLEDKLRALGIDVIIINEQQLSSYGIAYRLRRIAKINRTDIIHTHRMKENVIGGMVAFSLGIKSVRTAHGAAEFPVTFRHMKRCIFNSLDIFVACCFQQKIISVSDELASKLAVTFSEKKIVVIENSVNEKEIVASSQEQVPFVIDDTVFNVAFIGRFVPVKRTDIFYEFARESVDLISGTRVNFYMIGDGPLWETVNKRVESDNLSDSIKLTGFIENVAPILKDMDLLVFTSDHEGLPMTLLEAMTLNVPVMSRDLTTIKKLLCGGRCGCIVEGDSASDFVEALEKLIADHGVLEDYSTQARSVIEDQYGVQNKVSEYLALYEKVTV